MNQRLYFYRSRVLSVYDGDTIRVDLDLGCGLHSMGENGKGLVLRLWGINAPELRGPERDDGLKSRDWLRDALSPENSDYPLIVETKLDKTGKFGRLLAVLWQETDNGWVNLNRRMVDLGLAREYLP